MAGDTGRRTAAAPGRRTGGEADAARGARCAGREPVADGRAGRGHPAAVACRADLGAARGERAPGTGAPRRPPAAAAGRRIVDVGRVGARGPPGHGQGAATRRGTEPHPAAVRQLRAVALGERPVLPPLRHPPGLTYPAGASDGPTAVSSPGDTGSVAGGAGCAIASDRTRVHAAPSSSRLKLIDIQARTAKAATNVP